MTDEPPPALVSTPPATKKTTCRSCGAPIYFARTSTGKLTPISLVTNENHFADCPAAKEWRGKGKAPA